MNALVLDHVTKRYGDHVAVDDVSFVVPRGVVFGILGPNGAGKSTAIRMVNDIITPDSGTITLFGDVPPGRHAAPRLGFLPEERGLYPKMRVLDVLVFIGELRGLSGKVAKARAGAWLERLGLGAWQKHKVQDLSKGMQQKVQFAAMLLHEPELVILDEPWSGLDPINAEVLRDVVVELRAAGKTVMLSTHQMEQAEKICDHVCIIARGKVVLDGALADIKRAAANDHRVTIASNTQPWLSISLLDDPAWVVARHEERGELTLELAPTATPDAFLKALVDAGVSLRKFEIVTPSLHQIFVARVGPEAATASRVDPRAGARS